MDYYQRREWAFAQHGMSSAEKFILVAMAKRTGNESAEYYQSIASLCEETELNRKTAIKSLKALCESGFIVSVGWPPSGQKMSVAATQWAWRQALKPAAKLVLLALADRANDAGECWPSVHRSQIGDLQISKKNRMENV